MPQIAADAGGGESTQMVDGQLKAPRQWPPNVRIAKVEDPTDYRPKFFSKLILIVNLIWNFLFERAGKHNSKIEIPSC